MIALSRYLNKISVECPLRDLLNISALKGNVFKGVFTLSESECKSSITSKMISVKYYSLLKLSISEFRSKMGLNFIFNLTSLSL